MKTRLDVMPLIAGGAAAVAWPLAARGQLNGPMRRVGALMHFAPDASGGKSDWLPSTKDCEQRAGKRGATYASIRAGPTGVTRNCASTRRNLVALDPEVILAWATPTVFALQRVSRTVPIVFSGVIDPLASD